MYDKMCVSGEITAGTINGMEFDVVTIDKVGQTRGWSYYGNVRDAPPKRKYTLCGYTHNRDSAGRNHV